MKKTYLCCSIIILWSLAISPAFTFEEVVPRYALIIGNANYQYTPLKNPINDAKAMAKKLRSLRYDVTELHDQNPQQMQEALERFYESIKEDNAISLFYFSGHGVQANNINYLLPVNSNIASFDTLTSKALSTNKVLSALKKSNSHQHIIILDACRNNPFKVLLNNEGVVRSAVIEGNIAEHNGLAAVKAPAGTLIAYATEPGKAAFDGSGKNGTYTSALLSYIGKSETAEELFKKVRLQVLSKTNNKQLPWEHSSLTEKFYFSPPANEEIPDIPNF